MDSRQRHGYHALDGDDHPAVSCPLHLHEHTLTAGKVAACDAYAGTLGEVHFFGTEVQKLVAVGAGCRNEVAHLDIGDDNLLMATCIRDVLQVREFVFHPTQFSRTGIYEQQVAHHRHQFLHPTAMAQAEYNLAEIWITVITDVRAAYDNYITYLKQVKLFQKTYELTKQTRDLVAEEYKAGNAELTRLKNTEITLDFTRHGQPMSAQVALGNDGKLGVSVLPFTAFLPVEHVQYTFWQSIPAGVQFGWETLTSYVKQLKLVFTKEGAQSLGGFGAIGQLFPTAWDWTTFWFMTAFLSIILAFMNILPIPALDGGHALFVLYEMITRRKPSDKFMEYAQTVGLLILFALLIYANGNDIVRLFK